MPVKVDFLSVVGEQTTPVNALCLSPSGSVLVVSDDETATLWRRLESGHYSRAWAFPSPFLCTGFSRDGELIAAGVRGVATIWTPQGELVRELGGFDGFVTTIAFVGDHILVTGDSVGQLRLYSTAGWEQVGSWDCATDAGEPISREQRVDAVAVSGDGRQIVVLCGGTSGAQVWSYVSNKRALSFKTRLMPAAPVSTVAFSPLGKVLAVARFGQVDGIHLFDADTLHSAGVMYLPQEEPMSLAFSPNGHYLAVIGGDGNVLIYHIPSQRLALSFAAHPGERDADIRDEYATGYNSIAWSPSGDALVTWGYSSRPDREPASDGETRGAVIKLWRVSP